MSGQNQNKIAVFKAIANSVMAQGSDTMFGLLGDANLFMADEYVRSYGGTFIPATHENNAVLMALGFAQVTGKTGVATITHGPALTNCLTALVEGVKGTLPVVLLCGDTPVADRDGAQNLPQRELVLAAGAGFEQMRSLDTVTVDIATAFRRARIERRPIVLNMPRDFMWQETAAQPIVHAIVDAPTNAALGTDLENAVGILAAAKRPIILVGRGAVSARAEIVELANRIGAPLATTLKANGLFQAEPFGIGVHGTISTPAAVDTILASDCVVAFGVGFNRFTTVDGAYLEGKRIIQIDTQLVEIGKNAQIDAGLVGDPGLVAKTMIHWLDEAEIPSSGFTNELDETALKSPHPIEKTTQTEGFIDLTQALMVLETAIPDDRILVSDGGRFMGEAWIRFSVAHPRNFFQTTNTGAIGLGMGQAIGAAHSGRGQPVLLATGDGGFMMGGLSEFSTAVQTKRDLIVAICNDQAYGAEYVQFTDRQMDPTISQFNWPSFAEVAIAMGGQGVTVENAADLDKAVQAIADRDGPLLIDLRIDPALVPRMQF